MVHDKKQLRENANKGRKASMLTVYDVNDVKVCYKGSFKTNLIIEH